MDRAVNPELTMQRNVPVSRSGDRRPLALLNNGADTIGYHHPSFIQLYYAIEARRTSSVPLVVQFISAAGGSGASTVASGYARVAAESCAKPILYVDCNPKVRSKSRPSLTEDSRPTLFDVYRGERSLSEALAPASDSKNLLWARLASGVRPILWFGGDRMQELLDMLRTSYPLIVLDTPSAEEPESAAISRYCDGTVLVVAAGRTKQPQVENARLMLERFGGQMVGLVLNRERSFLPRWLGG